MPEPEGFQKIGAAVPRRAVMARAWLAGSPETKFWCHLAGVPVAAVRWLAVESQTWKLPQAGELLRP